MRMAVLRPALVRPRLAALGTPRWSDQIGSLTVISGGAILGTYQTY